MVSLVGGRFFVEVNEDDESNGVLDGDSDIGIGRHWHLQPPTPHYHTLIAGEDQPVFTVQDDSVRCDLKVWPVGFIDEDGDGAKVSALFLVAAGRSGGPD